MPYPKDVAMAIASQGIRPRQIYGSSRGHGRLPACGSLRPLAMVVLLASLSLTSASDVKTQPGDRFAIYDEATRHFDFLVDTHLPLVHAKVAKIQAMRNAERGAEESNRRQREFTV